MVKSPIKLVTLCFVYKHPQVLLGLKKRGFGEGRWNSFGGKVERGETLEDAAIRELKEESGLVAEDLKFRGVVDFAFANIPGIMRAAIFLTENFSGDPVETEEMRPRWFAADNLPFSEMWPEAKYLFPLILAGKKVRGEVFYDERGKEILERKLFISENE